MSITQPIPEEAYPAIRELVTAGVKIPPAAHWKLSRDACLRVLCRGKCRCPLGLHPESHYHEPWSSPSFLGRNSEQMATAVPCFIRWWDTQRDAAAAVKELRRVMRVLKEEP